MTAGRITGATVSVGAAIAVGAFLRSVRATATGCSHIFNSAVCSWPAQHPSWATPVGIGILVVGCAVAAGLLFVGRAAPLQVVDAERVKRTLGRGDSNAAAGESAEPPAEYAVEVSSAVSDIGTSAEEQQTANAEQNGHLSRDFSVDALRVAEIRYAHGDISRDEFFQITGDVRTARA